MNRAHQIKFCKVCIHRKMDIQQGLLCQLTNEKADFEGTCPSFEKDEKDTSFGLYESAESTKKKKPRSKYGWVGAIGFSVLGFVRSAIHQFDDIFGVVFFLLGILWLVVALVERRSR